MNLYVVTDCDCGGYCEWECLWEAVWAPDETAAVKHCVKRSEDPSRLRNVGDGFVPEGVTPRKPVVHVEARDAVKRLLGFESEGDRPCGTCGLYELDGLAPVCEECEQCPDCGCECADEPVFAHDLGGEG